MRHLQEPPLAIMHFSHVKWRNEDIVSTLILNLTAPDLSLHTKQSRRCGMLLINSTKKMRMNHTPQTSSMEVSFQDHRSALEYANVLQACGYKSIIIDHLCTIPLIRNVLPDHVYRFLKGP